MEKRGLCAALRACGGVSVDGIYWADEMRLGLMGDVRRVWAARGVKVFQQVECKREWIYLNLAVNGVSGQLRWGWSTSMKSVALASVVSQWSERGVEVVVWDRARGHYGQAYEGLGVHRVEQPAYSPELNPAERVFAYIRSEIEGKVYGTLGRKREAVEAVLRGLASEPERVKRLCGWDWIVAAVKAVEDANTVFQ